MATPAELYRVRTVGHPDSTSTARRVDAENYAIGSRLPPIAKSSYFRMRRRLRLRILYRSLFASAAAIGLVAFGWSPECASWLGIRSGGEEVRPGNDNFSGANTVGKVCVDLSSTGLAEPAELWPAVETLVQENPVADPLMVDLAARDFATDTQDSSPIASLPILAERIPALPAEALATVELLAPIVRVEEELAGLDWEAGNPDSRAVSPRYHMASAATGPMLVATLDATNPAVVGEGRLGGNAPAGDRDAVADAASDLGMPDRSGRSRHGLGGGWPETPALLEGLEQLASLERGQPSDSRLASTAYPTTVRVTDLPAPERFRGLGDWQRDVRQSLQELQQLASIAAPESSVLLATLNRLAQQGVSDAERMDDREAQRIALRTAQALSRRVHVWQAAHRATLSAATVPLPAITTPSDPVDIQRRIDVLTAELAGREDAEGWSRFLLLEEISAACRDSSDTRRRLVSQRFLARLNRFGLTPAQQAWLASDTIAALAAAVRPWAVGPVDYAALLGQLERQETDAIDLGEIDVARGAQSLRFASSAEAVELADAIDRHYRNANIRLSVSDQWINRLVPEVEARVQPVRQRILGADVRGQSQIRSTVAIRLVPSPHSWKFQLETVGSVVSNTASRNGPVSIRSISDADFKSVTPVEIQRAAVAVDPTQVRVDSQTRVRGIDTDYDSVPLLNSLVREIARSRYHDSAPVAKGIQHRQIGDGVGGEIDRRLRDQLDQGSDKLSRHITGPLAYLGLNPKVLDMQTTADRLTARYRVGGDWQLAAFTPRPRAPSDSLLSVQVHQSVFNNTLETVLPHGQPVAVSEIIGQLQQRFGLSSAAEGSATDADESMADTLVQFSSTRPVTIEIEDGMLWVTLRVQRLHRPKSIDLRRFIVRVCYRYEVDGLRASLVRDAHLRISGPNLSIRDRLPIRAIFNKVFSSTRPLTLVPETLAQLPAMKGLVITQFELSDGWFGVAFGPASAANGVTRADESVAEEAESALPSPITR